LAYSFKTIDLYESLEKVKRGEFDFTASYAKEAEAHGTAERQIDGFLTGSHSRDREPK
jgi:hypothetical protein